ncbi:MAG: hypothetical protein HQL32_09420 [Planctomycetes bacterium]|nr:hypothetical protein [Planctomycetota bacterium]
MVKANDNIKMIEEIVSIVGPLVESLIFVGGSVVSFYIERADHEEFRPTDDVDAVVHVSTLMDYYEIDQKLRNVGFQNCNKKGAPICRYIHGKLIFDVTPDDINILGFSNPWYRNGCKEAIEVDLPAGSSIKILSLPYFLCTKIEAFNTRGSDDLIFSHDLEDISFVLRSLLDAKSILNGPSEVQAYLRKFFRRIIRDFGYIDYLYGEYPGTRDGQIDAEHMVDFLKSL